MGVSLEGFIIKSMGNNVFQKCEQLTDVDLTEMSGNVVRENTFNGCVKLKSVVLPNKQITIETRGFDGCEKLETINVDKIKNVGNYAFSGCNKLTAGKVNIILNNIDLNDNSNLGTYVFNDCIGIIDRVELPENIKNIPIGLFNGCINLDEINFDKLSILTDIGTEAFKGCSLTSVNFNSNIKTIGSKAFTECSKLNSIVFDNSNTSLKIGEEAFYDCVGLSVVDISRTLVPTNGWDYKTNWFGSKIHVQTELELNINTTYDIDIKLGYISKLIVNRSDSVTLKLKSTHPLIKDLNDIHSGQTMRYHDISFNIEWDLMIPNRKATLTSHNFSVNGLNVNMNFTNLDYNAADELSIFEYQLKYKYSGESIINTHSKRISTTATNFTFTGIRKGVDVDFWIYPVNRDGVGIKASDKFQGRTPVTNPDKPTIDNLNFTTVGNTQNSKFTCYINMPDDVGKWYDTNDTVNKVDSIKYFLAYEIDDSSLSYDDSSLSYIEIIPNSSTSRYFDSTTSWTFNQEGRKSINLHIYTQKITDGLNSAVQINNGTFPFTQPDNVTDIREISYVNNTVGNISIKLNWTQPTYMGGGTANYGLMIKNTSGAELLSSWVDLNLNEVKNITANFNPGKELYNYKGYFVNFYIKTYLFENNGLVKDSDASSSSVPTTVPGKLLPAPGSAGVVVGTDYSNNKIRLKWYTLEDTGGSDITEYKIKWYGSRNVTSGLGETNINISRVSTSDNISVYDLYTSEYPTLKSENSWIYFHIIAFNVNGTSDDDLWSWWDWAIDDNRTTLQVKNIRLLPRWPDDSGVKDNNDPYQPTEDTKSYIDISWNVYDFGNGFNLTDNWHTNISFKINLQYHRWRWTKDDYDISWKDITTINLPFNQDSNTGRSYIGLDKKGWEFGYSWQVPDRFKGYIIRVRIEGTNYWESPWYISDEASNITYNSVTNGIGHDFKQGDNIWTYTEHKALMDIQHWAKISPTLRGDNWKSSDGKGGRCMAPETGPNITMVNRLSNNPLAQFRNAIVYDILTVNDGHRVNNYWKTGTYKNNFRTTGNFDYSKGKLLILSKYDTPIYYNNNPDGYSDTTRNYIGSFSAPNVVNGDNIEQSILRELWVEVWDPLSDTWGSPGKYDSTIMSPDTDTLGYELCTQSNEGKARLWIIFRNTNGCKSKSKKIELTFPLKNPKIPSNPTVEITPVNNFDRLKITWDPPETTSDYRKYDYSQFVRDDYRYRVKIVLTNGGYTTYPPSSGSGTVWDGWLYSANLIKEVHITTILPVRSSGECHAAGGWGDENWPEYDIWNPNSYYESYPVKLVMNPTP